MQIGSDLSQECLIDHFLDQESEVNIIIGSKMKRQLYILLSVMIMISCNKYSRKEFTFERTENLTNEIKLNGYYYNKKDPNSYLVFFLFRNGIYFGGVSLKSTNLTELDEEVKKLSENSNKDLVYLWGVYKLERGNIIIEKWKSGTGGKGYAHSTGKYLK